MLSNESRNWCISSLCLILGRGAEKFPFATSSADAASCFNGFVARLMTNRPTKRVMNKAMAISTIMMTPMPMAKMSTIGLGTTEAMLQLVFSTGS